MRKVAVAPCLLLLASLIVQSANSTPATPEYVIQVQQTNANVSLSIHAFQNFTSFTQFQNFSLPQFQVMATGPNATGLEAKFQDAVRTINPQASVSNLRLEAVTSIWLNTTKRQWMNTTASFIISGIVENSPGARSFDLSWKSLSIPSNMTLEGHEINRIGEAYFESIARTLSQFHFTAQTRIFLRVNGQSMIFSLFSPAVAKIAALNFTALNTPLSQWQSAYVPLVGQTYKMAVKGLGLSFERAVTATAEQTEEIRYYGLFYDIQAGVSVPEGSHVKGDVVIQNSNVPETIMGAVILSAIVLGSGVYFYERRLVKIPFRRKSKR